MTEPDGTIPLVDEGRHQSWLAHCLASSSSTPLSTTDAELLLCAMQVIEVAAGAELMSRYEPSDRVFVLERGRVALSRPNSDRSRMLQIHHPGDTFGDVGLFLNRPIPVDAVALEDAELLVIDGKALLDLIGTRPGIAMRWMVSLAQRVADAQDRLEDLLAGPLDYQLASLLIHAAGPDGVVSTSQETLAHLLGARRPSVARSLANLERQGLVEKHYRQVRIVDLDRLAALTD
ncbi:MAG: Crp/Fnr family transcriptional regulator [Acidimicrobiales bacterium]